MSMETPILDRYSKTIPNLSLVKSACSAGALMTPRTESIVSTPQGGAPISLGFMVDIW